MISLVEIIRGGIDEGKLKNFMEQVEFKFIYSFNKHIFRISGVSGTVLGSEGPRIRHSHPLHQAHIVAKKTKA